MLQWSLGVHVSFQTIFFCRYMPRSGIAGSYGGSIFSFFFFLFIYFYCSGFCHTLKWNSHGFTCIPHPDPPSLLPLHQIPRQIGFLHLITCIYCSSLSFHGKIAHLFLALSNIPLSGCTTVYVSVHLLTYGLVTSKLWWLWIKPL